MLDAIIRFCLRKRVAVLILATVLMSYGIWVGSHLPIDVFPDLNRPTVTVLTESHGLAPDEVETLVTMPVESVLNGIPGVVRIRSSSGIGISIVTVEFEWGTEIYQNRQLISERIQLLSGKLPPGMMPMMGPVSSIMGEIQFIGLTSPDSSVSAQELRTLADWTIRPRLMALPGVSQVVVMGGDVKQFQVLLSSEKLQKRGISLEAFQEVLSKISNNTTGGFIDIDDLEYLIRPLGRVETVEEIENSVIGVHLGRPVLVKDVAKVQIAAKTKRGEASINGKHAIVMTIQKQPHASTIALTKDIDKLVSDIEPTLPVGLNIEKDLFKQAHFIKAAIYNVEEALFLGAVIISIVLFIFLANVRTTIITLITIPLSLLVSAIVFKLLNMSINTMTLGGFAIAIGELVDDAIVDVENVFRRLRENHKNGSQKGHLRVIFEASSEVRNSIVFSTITVVLVVCPLFFLSGIEGRLFAPLAIAYIVSILASLVVSLTVTPVLCSYLLKGTIAAHEKGDTRFVTVLKNWQETILNVTFDRPKWVLSGCLLLFLGVACLIPRIGQNFLPEFNEGTATIGVAANPGISLAASDKLGTDIEKAILSVAEVKSTVRRTGRAEMDEHAEGVHWSEIDVDFKSGGRDKSEVLQEIRTKIEKIGDEKSGGIYVNIGQPISHRLDHLLSGVRAQIAIKIFGPDLAELRRLGALIETELNEIQGITDLSLEPLVLIPQLKIAIDRDAASSFAIRPGELAEDLERALNGEVVGQIIENQRIFDMVMRLDDNSRNNSDNMNSLLIKTLPNGQLLRLSDVADVYEGSGPNMINREKLQRRLVISANTKDRDLGGIVQEIQKRLATSIELPEGYYLSLEGQFEHQQKAFRLLIIFSCLSLVVIIGILYIYFRSFILVVQVLLNIPLAFIGSVFAIYVTGIEFSVATLIAFITLCGIASRNGIMMISHYNHLIQSEGEVFSKETILRGSQERIVPVLMTALTAALALAPLLLSKGQAGKEILYPVAVVIIGGLVSSTLLDLIVTPTLFYNYGKKPLEKSQNYLSRVKEKEGEWK